MSSSNNEWVIYRKGQTSYKEIDLDTGQDKTVFDFKNGSSFDDSISSAAGLLTEDNISRVPLYRIFFLVVYRFVKITIGGLWFMAGMLWRLLTIPKRVKRTRANAAQARILLEWLGGAFVKIGQQMSLRYDLLPAAYCNELYKMQDNVPAISYKKADRILKRNLGPNYQALFTVLNLQKPVGAASIACTYKGILNNGGKIVAVKIRRPGTVKRFSADMAIIDLLFITLEFFAILKSGFSSNFRAELSQILFEEMNFKREARFQELFNIYFKKQDKLKARAPLVYKQYTTQEVMVSQFVSGFWMKDILPLYFKLENGGVITDHEAQMLAKLTELDIDPRVLAKQLIGISFYSFYECPFFHGDPHPGNILVKPNNEIVMIDFGACGVFSEKERDVMRAMHFYYSKEDVGGMVRSVIKLMEPLPNMDIDSFINDLESDWWDGFYGVKSEEPEWWERTSLRLWLAFLKQVRRYQVPIPNRVIRMVRATLLYDTVAAQLYKNINVWAEYQHYYEQKAERIKKEMNRDLLHQLFHGPNAMNYLKLQEVLEVGQMALARAKDFLSVPTYTFSQLFDKIGEFIGLFGKLIIRALSYALLAVLFVLLFHPNRDVLIEKPENFKEAIEYNLSTIGITTYEEDTSDDFDEKSAFISRVFWVLLVVEVLVIWSYLRRMYRVFAEQDQKNR